MRYLPHTKQEIEQMLAVLGVSSIEDLFESIPEDLRFEGSLPLDEGLSELELIGRFKEYAALNSAHEKKRFLAAGAPQHFSPAFADQMLLRSEYYTAYTPYQPEISQGTLQAIFEFQSMVASIFGMPVANASMYDGATATAEAALMAQRVLRNKRNRILMAKNLHPEWREVVRTYLVESESDVEEIPYDERSGTITKQALAAMLDSNTACAIFSYPSFFGTLQDLSELAQMVHDAGALMIIAVPEPVALGLMKSPGEMGADIAIGEGIGLSGALNFGGPGVGLFAVQDKFVRQMPGRLVGETIDSQGRRGYVLTLATREQHIRRAKATSNICTNHGLIALAFAMNLAWYGKSGFQELAKHNHAKANYLRTKLSEAGFSPIFEAPIFNEFAIRLNSDAAELVQTALEHDFIIGLPLARFYPELGEDALLVATNEMHTKQDIENYVELLKELN